MPTVHRWLLGAVLVLGLSACSSARAPHPGTPDGRVVRTPEGDVIVMRDGRVYRDRNRNGIPDRDEDRRTDRRPERRSTRVAVCHKGRTMTVAASAARAHVRHGDRVGTCRPSDRRDDRHDRDDDDDDEDRREHRRGKRG